MYRRKERMKEYPNYPEGNTMGYNLCISCGMALTTEELEEELDTCSDCIELGDSDPYLPLDFD